MYGKFRTGTFNEWGLLSKYCFVYSLKNYLSLFLIMTKQLVLRGGIVLRIRLYV